MSILQHVTVNNEKSQDRVKGQNFDYQKVHFEH